MEEEEDKGTEIEEEQEDKGSEIVDEEEDKGSEIVEEEDKGREIADEVVCCHLFLMVSVYVAVCPFVFPPCLAVRLFVLASACFSFVRLVPCLLLFFCFFLHFRKCEIVSNCVK